MVGYNKMQNRRVVTYIGRNMADHAIRNSVAITKLLLGCDIRKKKKRKRKRKKKIEMRFFENNFSQNFLSFWLSYSTYSIITGSGTQQVNFMEKFCVKAGISCKFILY